MLTTTKLRNGVQANSNGQGKNTPRLSRGDDGGVPEAGLVADKSGNLYGTTAVGGGTGCGGSGCGTVYKIAPDGTETLLYSFLGAPDGQWPSAALLTDENGNLYGTTGGGGANKCNGNGCGTVFEIGADGSYSVIYSFKGTQDGWDVEAGLTADSSGNLYGTTEPGGSAYCEGGCGTVFSVAPDGTEAVLYSFTGRGDGEAPLGSLVMDASGNLYGTTQWGGGGSHCDKGLYCGTVFELGR